MTWYIHVVETAPPSQRPRKKSNTSLYAGMAILAILTGVVGYALARRR